MSFLIFQWFFRKKNSHFMKNSTICFLFLFFFLKKINTNVKITRFDCQHLHGFFWKNKICMKTICLFIFSLLVFLFFLFFFLGCIAFFILLHWKRKTNQYDNRILKNEKLKLKLKKIWKVFFLFFTLTMHFARHYTEYAWEFYNYVIKWHEKLGMKEKKRKNCFNF